MAQQSKEVVIIAAVAFNGTIGKNGGLPWYLPSDLRHFQQMTRGNTVVMGRGTYESIGKALPDRETIIVTRQENYRADECIVVHSLEEALKRASSKRVYIGGGIDIYREAAVFATHMLITAVHASVEGDRVFPLSNNPYTAQGWHAVSIVGVHQHEEDAYKTERVSFIKTENPAA